MLPYPEIDPVALALGPVKVHWYGLTYLTGLAFAWWLAARRTRRPWSVVKREQVDDLIFYGDLNDMSGGYHVGDTVFNFTVYDFDGNSIELYEELAGEKPVVIINGSVSCLRFRNAFNSLESHQSYFVVNEFIENTQDMFNYIVGWASMPYTKM